jgi:hypothetical protein
MSARAANGLVAFDLNVSDRINVAGPEVRVVHETVVFHGCSKK